MSLAPAALERESAEHVETKPRPVPRMVKVGSDLEQLSRVKKEYQKLVEYLLKASSDEHNKRSGQGKALCILKKDYGDLHRLLTFVKKDKSFEQQCMKLSCLIRSNNSHKLKIAQQKRELDELDLTICLKEHKVAKLQMVAKRVSLVRSDEVGERRLKLIENRLDTNVKQYCTLMAENRQMRQVIDLLLDERREFNQKFAALMAQLQLGKHTLTDVMDKIMHVQQQRDKWRRKYDLLYARARDTFVLHLGEMRRTHRREHVLHSLAKFLVPKTQRRRMEHHLEEIRGKQARQRKLFEMQLRDYRHMVRNITTFIGEHDSRTICREYLEREYQNFTRFNYVNLLYKEVEHLSDETIALHVRIEMRKEHIIRVESRRNESIAKLEEILNHICKENNQLKRTIDHQRDKIRYVTEHVDNIYEALDCGAYTPSLADGHGPMRIFTKLQSIETVLNHVAACKSPGSQPMDDFDMDEWASRMRDTRLTESGSVTGVHTPFSESIGKDTSKAYAPWIPGLRTHSHYN